MTGTLRPDVAVVGAGPAGLTAAAELACRGLDVLVLEREREPGGVPRHCDHTGFGMRDLRRVLRGPAYAARLAARVLDAGATVRTEATVTGWVGERGLRVTSPHGLLAVEADAVILATGARERPRPARWVPGDRPAEVYTTGQLQQLVHQGGRRLSGRAVIVGSEPVSWSAVLTLREAGARVGLMATEADRIEAPVGFALAGRHLLRVPVRTSARVSRVVGRERVQAVEVTHVRTGAVETVPCDLAVFTGDWIPDHELARDAGIELDPASRGPLVDQGSRTSRPGVFAAGNLVHPVATADVAALGGRLVAGTAAAGLGASDPISGARIVAGEGLRWVTPGVLAPGEPVRRRLSAWPERHVPRPVVVARQGDRTGRVRTWWPAAPGRIFEIPARLIEGLDPAGLPIEISLSR